MMEVAVDVAEAADIFLVIGTSLAVYPAAGLVNYVGRGKPIYIVDPAKPEINLKPNMTFIQDKATTGMETLIQKYLLPDK
jgi:NAD-dependent deacetylase